MPQKCIHVSPRGLKHATPEFCDVLIKLEVKFRQRNSVADGTFIAEMSECEFVQKFVDRHLKSDLNEEPLAKRFMHEVVRKYLVTRSFRLAERLTEVATKGEYKTKSLRTRLQPEDHL